MDTQHSSAPHHIQQAVPKWVPAVGHHLGSHWSCENHPQQALELDRGDAHVG